MHYFLGIEIKGNQAKIAACIKSGSTLELIKLDSFSLPVDADETSRQLSTWISQNLPDQTSIKAVLTISESSLYLKELEFPKIPLEKLNEAVYWELPSIAPIPQADAVFDWQIMGEEKGMQKVLVIVGKSYIVQNMISVFRNAQIDVVAIEPSSSAFSRVANAPFNAPTLICLAEEQGTDYIILKNKLPIFTSSTVGQSQSAKIAQLKSGTDLLIDIMNEGNKILSYWQSKESDPIRQVIIAGDLVFKFIGTSNQLKLFPTIPAQIGTIKKIKHFSTGTYQEFDLANYLIAIGASVRYLQSEVLEGINLFPAAEKAKSTQVQAQKKQTAHLMKYAVTNLALLVTILTTIIAYKLLWYSLEKRSNELSNEYASRSPVSLINEINSANQTIQDVTVLSKRQVDSGARLKSISENIPQTLQLTQIDMIGTKSEKWTITGVGDRNSILAYQKKLTDSTRATKVEMAYSSLNKNTPDNEFILTILW